MKRSIYLAAFFLATFSWAVAQQPSNAPMPGDAQATSPSSQATGQPQTTAPGAAGPNAPQAGPQSGAPGQAVNGPITEGCLGGSSPNFTITDTAGKTYKLVLPPNADGSRLTPHVGESVQVMGDVKQAGGSTSIDVNKIGKGSGTCPGK